jgi:hypothetical protein
MNCGTRRCSHFLGPRDNFLQSYGAIFTDRAATGSGTSSLMDPMSTMVCIHTVLKASAIRLEAPYF